jgi:hypothetical protein
MADIDYSEQKGVADETHWNMFVLAIGGQLVSPLIRSHGVKNADYIFPAAKVIAELKILQTEFAHTKQAIEKVDALIEKYAGSDPGDRTSPLYRELLMVLRKPLQRIINTANRQIKETKRELGLDDWSGVIICVNDGFRAVSPDLVLGLLGSVLSRTSYTNTDCLIYQTNHYVELSENPYANLLWHPMYSDDAKDELVDFVNDLGRNWNQFAREEGGALDFVEERIDLNLVGSSAVSGLYRKNRYTGE